MKLSRRQRCQGRKTCKSKNSQENTRPTATRRFHKISPNFSVKTAKTMKHPNVRVSSHTMMLRKFFGIPKNFLPLNFTWIQYLLWNGVLETVSILVFQCWNYQLAPFPSRGLQFQKGWRGRFPPFRQKHNKGQRL